MVTHYCLRCGANWSRKDVWRKHLKKKKPCKASYIDIERDEILNNYDEFIDEFIEMKDKIYKCDHCPFSTKHRKSLWRHLNDEVCIRNRTQVPTSISTTIGGPGINGNSNHLDASSTVNDHSTNITDNSNTQNNYNITNNFGKEDLSVMTFEKFQEIGECASEAIPRLIEEIHFNIPGNRNIDIPNVRGNYGRVYQNDRWEQVRLAQLLEDLLTNNHDRLEDLITKYSAHFPPRWIRNINRMLQNIDKKKKYKKEQKDMIKNVIITNRD